MASYRLRLLLLSVTIFAIAIVLVTPAEAAPPASRKVIKLLKRRPSNYKALYRLAVKAVQRRRYPDAKAIARYLLRSGIRHYKVYNLLGFVHYQYEAYEQSIEALNTSLQLRRNQRFAREWLVAARNRLKDCAVF